MIVSPSASVAETVKCVPVASSLTEPKDPAEVDQATVVSTFIAFSKVDEAPEGLVTFTE